MGRAAAKPKPVPFVVEPHGGIGPIRLGAKRAEVRAAMAAVGLPVGHHEKSLDYFCENAVQVEYDKGRADFIGVALHERLLVTYRGTNVFDVTAKKLFALIAKNESKRHRFDEYEYCFPDQIVTLWDADSQYDRIGKEARVVWAQIGVGTPNYLAVTSELD